MIMKPKTRPPLTDTQDQCLAQIKLRHHIDSRACAVVLGAASRLYWEQTGVVLREIGEAAETLRDRNDLISRAHKMVRNVEFSGWR